MKGTKTRQAAMKISSLFGASDIEVRGYDDKEEEVRLDDGTIVVKKYKEFIEV